MRLTIIGCWGAYPAPGAGTAAYLLQHQGFNLLLDCGSGCLMSLPAYLAPEEIHALLLTHYHADHSADVGCLQHLFRLQRELGRSSHTPDFYGPADPDSGLSLSYRDYTRGHAITPGYPLPIGPFRCEAIWTPHPAPALAYRLSLGAGSADERSLVYSGDTGWSDELVALARDTDLLLCESSLYTRYEGYVQGHLSARQAGLIAALSGAASLVLTHFPHYGHREDLLTEAQAVYSGPTVLAEPGLSFDFNREPIRR